MRWYVFAQKADEEAGGGTEKAEEENVPPAQPPAKGPVTPLPSLQAPQNKVMPRNRMEQDKALKGMFRDIGWKSPEINKSLQKAPGAIWPLMQGIDKIVDSKPGTMEKAKTFFKKKELEIAPPIGAQPGARLEGVNPTIAPVPQSTNTSPRRKT